MEQVRALISLLLLKGYGEMLIGSMLEKVLAVCFPGATSTCSSDLCLSRRTHVFTPRLGRVSNVCTGATTGTGSVRLAGIACFEAILGPMRIMYGA